MQQESGHGSAGQWSGKQMLELEVWLSGEEGSTRRAQQAYRPGRLRASRVLGAAGRQAGVMRSERSQSSGPYRPCLECRLLLMGDGASGGEQSKELTSFEQDHPVRNEVVGKSLNTLVRT